MQPLKLSVAMHWWWWWCSTRLLLLTLMLMGNSQTFGVIGALTDRCKYCSLIVETFKTGMKRTENQHFAGGNTAWEEKNLGKFAKSETRLIEVMEYLCKLGNVADDVKPKFDNVKQIEFKCQQLVEEHEETIENWYFHKQQSDPDMFVWLCHERLTLCCPEGHYGRDCKPCPGVDKGLSACFARGSCHGDGSREGNGKCRCNKGYVGFMCSNCDANYFPSNQTSTSIECKECHKACKGGCTKEGADGCKECRSGWLMDANEGCKDINECEDEGRCPDEHTYCLNTEGSFECSCVTGYVRDSDGKCIIDIQAEISSPSPSPSPEMEGPETEGLNTTNAPNESILAAEAPSPVDVIDGSEQITPKQIQETLPSNETDEKVEL